MHLELSPENQAFRQEVREFIAGHLTEAMRQGQSNRSPSTVSR